MHLGHGSTPQQKPRKAFEAAKQGNKRKIDFGESSLSTGEVYRKRWSPSSSLFWKGIKALFILFLLVAMFSILRYVLFQKY
jgi:hypothetical protein